MFAWKSCGGSTLSSLWCIDTRLFVGWKGQCSLKRREYRCQARSKLFRGNLYTWNGLKSMWWILTAKMGAACIQITKIKHFSSLFLLHICCSYWLMQNETEKQCKVLQVLQLLKKCHYYSFFFFFFHIEISLVLTLWGAHGDARVPVKQQWRPGCGLVCWSLAGPLSLQTAATRSA